MCLSRINISSVLMLLILWETKAERRFWTQQEVRSDLVTCALPVVFLIWLDVYERVWYPASTTEITTLSLLFTLWGSWISVGVIAQCWEPCDSLWQRGSLVCYLSVSLEQLKSVWPEAWEELRCHVAVLMTLLRPVFWTWTWARAITDAVFV